LVSPARRADYDRSTQQGEPTPPQGTPVTNTPGPTDTAKAPNAEVPVYVKAKDALSGVLPEGQSVKPVLVALAVIWVLAALIFNVPVIPGVSNASAIGVALWLALVWIFGSIVLRLVAWALAIVALALAYFSEVAPFITVSRLALAFVLWLCGQWFFTFRKGRWRSRIALSVFSRFPNSLRPDKRWENVY